MGKSILTCFTFYKLKCFMCFVSQCETIECIGLAYDGGTSALGADRLGSIPSSPTIQDKSNFSLGDKEDY